MSKRLIIIGLLLTFLFSACSLKKAETEKEEFIKASNVESARPEEAKHNKKEANREKNVKKQEDEEKNDEKSLQQPELSDFSNVQLKPPVPNELPKEKMPKRLDNLSGKEMSYEDVVELGEKGEKLRFSDLQKYQSFDASSNFDSAILVYAVGKEYRMVVVVSVKTKMIESISLESIGASGGSGIDIRYYDVATFLETGNRVEKENNANK